MNKICERCNKEFTAKRPTRKFCKLCRSKSVKNICKKCDKIFFHKKSKVGKYCSLKCLGKSFRKELNKSECKTCKKQFEFYKWNGKGIYCSVPCKQMGSRLTRREQLDRLRIYFERDVIRRDGCWGWNGPVSSNGYGSIGAGTNFKISAHRASWLLYKGEIPKGMFVMHSCDNRLCNNYLEHLSLGTQKDNMQDALKKGRMRGHFTKGQISHNKKITTEQENIIRELKGKITLKEIAQQLNLTIDSVKGFSNKLFKEKQKENL